MNTNRPSIDSVLFKIDNEVRMHSGNGDIKDCVNSIGRIINQYIDYPMLGAGLTWQESLNRMFGTLALWAKSDVEEERLNGKPIMNNPDLPTIVHVSYSLQKSDKKSPYFCQNVLGMSEESANDYYNSIAKQLEIITDSEHYEIVTDTYNTVGDEIWRHVVARRK